MTGAAELQWLDSHITVAESGAKAANLAQLIAWNYDVPRGFVIPGRHYRSHLHRHGLDAECRRLIGALPDIDALTLARQAAALRDAIRRAPVEPGLLAAILAMCGGQCRWPVAVRSSAIAEDSSGVSFAGQLDSVLHISDAASLTEAIKTVWASAWSDRCLRYAQHQGQPPGDVAVVIQQQVDARFSGVLFTRDPIGNHDAAVVEYVDGLGEALVSGQVSPARAIVRYPGLQIEHSETTADSLPDAALRQLARTGLVLERRLGGAQDVEWSIDADGQLWLLQARPAKVSAKTRYTAWSNANIAENFPDPVTPFLFSVVSRGYTAYFRNLGRGFGISEKRVAAMAPELERLVGLHAGRLYYNLSAIHGAIRLAPGGDQLAEWFNNFTGAKEYPETTTILPGRLGRVAEWIRVVMKVVWQYLLIQHRIAAFEARADQYAERTKPPGIPLRTTGMLRDDLAAFMDIRLNRWNDAALADVAAMVCYGLLKKQLQWQKGGADMALQNDLLKGMPALASARPVNELWLLATELRGSSISEQIATLPAGEVLDLLRRPEHAELHRKFTGYLDRWGFRYSRELMLTSPTPQEDPVPMIRILQNYLRSTGVGPAAIVAEQAAARLAKTRLVERRLSPSAWWRCLPFSKAGRFRILLRATHGAIRLRERARMKQALLYTRLRHVALGIGDRLTAQGILAEREDVFLLSADEVLGLLDGRTAETVENLVADRRAAFAACAALQPPDSLHLPDGEVWIPGATRSLPDPDCSPTEEVGLLRGVSACGGSFEGIAAVVEHVSEIDRIRNGEVLVTRQTDPGWAAVFFLVKGLVIERGGMLSHGAIIAREYGIPAVVGVPAATRNIRNGERIRVDGDHGVVETGL